MVLMPPKGVFWPGFPPSANDVVLGRPLIIVPTQFSNQSHFRSVIQRDLLHFKRNQGRSRSIFHKIIPPWETRMPLPLGIWGKGGVFGKVENLVYTKRVHSSQADETRTIKFTGLYVVSNGCSVPCYDGGCISEIWLGHLRWPISMLRLSCRSFTEIIDRLRSDCIHVMCKTSSLGCCSSLQRYSSSAENTRVLAVYVNVIYMN